MGSVMMPKGVSSMKTAIDLCVGIATNCHTEHLKVENKYTTTYCPIV